MNVMHSNEIVDIISGISTKLQTASDRAYLLVAREQYSPAFVVEKLRSEIIRPLEDALAQAKNLEDKLLGPVLP